MKEKKERRRNSQNKRTRMWSFGWLGVGHLFVWAGGRGKVGGGQADRILPRDNCPRLVSDNRTVYTFPTMHTVCSTPSSYWISTPGDPPIFQSIGILTKCRYALYPYWLILYSRPSLIGSISDGNKIARIGGRDIDFQGTIE